MVVKSYFRTVSVGSSHALFDVEKLVACLGLHSANVGGSESHDANADNDQDQFDLYQTPRCKGRKDARVGYCNDSSAARQNIPHPRVTLIGA